MEKATICAETSPLEGETDAEGTRQKESTSSLPKVTANPKLTAGWSLTNMCNLNCMHCYNSSGKRKDDELTTEEALKVVEKLAAAKVDSVNFGGGECALRPDFIGICQALCEKGIKVSYTTNGTVLKTIESHLSIFHDIGVSIDFADEKNHDLFRGRPGVFSKAMKCIDALVEQGVDTEIVTCLTKLNSTPRELSAIYHLAQEHNVDYWRLNRYRATGRALENDSFLGIGARNLQIAFDYLNYLNSLSSISTGKTLVSEPVFRAVYGGDYCIEGDPSGLYSFRIQPNGEVTPSVFLSLSGGNIKEKSIEEIFQSDIFRKIRDRKPEGKCTSCNEYYHCQGGDAGISYLAYNHFNGPDPLCFKDTTDPRNPGVRKIKADGQNVHALYLCTLYIPIRGDR